MTTSALISTQNLAFATPDGRVLAENLSFTVHPGEAVVISGGNGSGKSTLLRLLLGMSSEFTGFIDRYTDSVGYLPQLQDNEFHIPLRLRDILWMSSPQLEESKICQKLLTEDQLDLNWNQASGGERKRTLIARIFLQEPKLIVLDEPFNHLDQSSRKLMIECLGDYVVNRVSHEPGLLIVTHENHFQEREFHLPVREVRL